MDYVLIATIIASDGSRFDVKQQPGEDAGSFSNRVSDAQLPGDKLSVRRVKAQPWMKAELN